MTQEHFGNKSQQPIDVQCDMQSETLYKSHILNHYNNVWVRNTPEFVSSFGTDEANCLFQHSFFFWGHQQVDLNWMNNVGCIPLVSSIKKKEVLLNCRIPLKWLFQKTVVARHS